MGIRWAAGTRTLASMAAAGLLAAGVAACGASAGGSAAAPAQPAATSAPASQAPAAKSPAAKAQSPSKDTPADDSAATGPLPDYHPATVVSKSGSTTVLKSPRSLAKIGAFYKKALARGGWDTTASSMSSYHASFTAHRGHEGVNISVYPRAGESGISISRYQV
jgi:nucleoid-associated protein YgaU